MEDKIFHSIMFSENTFNLNVCLENHFIHLMYLNLISHNEMYCSFLDDIYLTIKMFIIFTSWVFLCMSKTCILNKLYIYI